MSDLEFEAYWCNYSNRLERKGTMADEQRDVDDKGWPDPVKIIVENLSAEIQRLREERDALRAAFEEALYWIGDDLFCGECEERAARCGCTPSVADRRRSTLRALLTPESGA